MVSFGKFTLLIETTKSFSSVDLSEALVEDGAFVIERWSKEKWSEQVLREIAKFFSENCWCDQKFKLTADNNYGSTACVHQQTNDANSYSKNAER